uniref:Heterokaryon incompatibility domain-containing protein n=1 Tax=Moniliophthora roreri TaxID=221103 RepID=A0A0W0EVD5_MONRR
MQTEAHPMVHVNHRESFEPRLLQPDLGRPAWARLILEDPGVKGCGWFHRRREDRFHVLANIIRLVFHIVAAPFTAFPVGEIIGEAAYNFGRAGWEDELVDVPEAVLQNPPDENGDPDPNSLGPPAILKMASSSSSDSLRRVTEVYATTNFEPRWMLLVFIRGGQYSGYRQIAWTEEFRGRGYTALSYDMEAAYTLFQEAGEHTLDPKPAGKARWSLRDRRRISEAFLREYCSAVGDQNEPLDRDEFVWLDELCISAARREGKRNQDEGEVKRERNEELGRMPDIYRGAKTVVAFCDVVDCDHTTLGCSWGKRLFTLSEILHANETRRMTRRLVQDESGEEMKRSFLYTEPAKLFRERMMHHAAIANKWHLHAILRQSNNSGSDTWQMAIHALIVEAIRRDRESGYQNHEYLAKGLNGLLPRRAQLHHLKGKDGWADLAWLLELNQGFYNTASLAAVCRLPDSYESGNGWLGPPIEPTAGNERLEPLVSAFPVGSVNKSGKRFAPLNVVGAQTIGLHPCLKRDSKALWRNPHARVKKIVSVIILVISWLVGVAVAAQPRLTGVGIAILWITSIGFNIFRLIVGATYLERTGWVFLSEKMWKDGSKGDTPWGSDPARVLRQIDPSFTELVDWGDRQMVPTWDVPEDLYMRGHLVDLRTGIKVRVVVSRKPNAMVVLGVHGSGVTYMLLDRPEDVHEVAVKVGMASLPPFTLAATGKSGSRRTTLPFGKKSGLPWRSGLH